MYKTSFRFQSVLCAYQAILTKGNLELCKVVFVLRKDMSSHSVHPVKRLSILQDKNIRREKEHIACREVNQHV